MQINRLKYSIEEIEQFGKYYQEGHSIKDTAEKFGINYHTLKQYLIKFNYRTPSKKLHNQRVPENHYFDEINTPEKAYFLGYWYSDGYISKTIYGTSVGIGLQLQDKYIIDKLCEEMKISNSIGIYKNSAKLQYTDQHTYDNLVRLGVQEDKSHKDFKLPNIPDELMNSFILGYFDGDGCITIKSTGYSVVSICCNSKVFLEEVKEWLDNKNIQTRPINIERGSRKNDLYILYLSGRENQLRFFDLIYKDCSIYLNRKHDKFMQIPR